MSRPAPQGPFSQRDSGHLGWGTTGETTCCTLLVPQWSQTQWAFYSMPCLEAISSRQSSDYLLCNSHHISRSLPLCKHTEDTNPSSCCWGMRQKRESTHRINTSLDESPFAPTMYNLQLGDVKGFIVNILIDCESLQKQLKTSSSRHLFDLSHKCSLSVFYVLSKYLVPKSDWLQFLVKIYYSFIWSSKVTARPRKKVWKSNWYKQAQK